ncbi:unnamed protein product [Rotaria sp. Silwood1]|nr:unnamed protein product [Rotaria sp. Silwood1]CAF4816233.1 unnamed protein product [Rotaria sp. Silwood1]
MMRLLIYFFVVFICKQGSATIYPCNTNASCGCSTSLTVVSRIAGGENAPRQSWSWIVSLRYNGKHFCGGTILSPSFIITTASCLTNIHDLNSITILAGSLTLQPSSNDLSQVRSIASIYKHPDFDYHWMINDIALLRLSTPLDMTRRNIKPICLPSGIVPQPPDNINMIAIGWGTTSTWTNTLSSTLLQVTLQSIASTFRGCQRVLSDTQRQFCAGIKTGGKDTCRGDGGGPLMTFVNNVWQLNGITSYGYGCALRGYPGVYTRVSYYIEWIKSILPSDEIATIITSTSETPLTSASSEEPMTSASSEEPIETTSITSEKPMETTSITSGEPITSISSEKPLETTSITSEKPMETTSITSETPMETTSITSETPMETTSITSETPMETTSITSEEPITSISTEEPMETTSITSERPMTSASSEEPMETTAITSGEPIITTASTSEKPSTAQIPELPFHIPNHNNYLRIQSLPFTDQYNIVIGCQYNI